MSLNMEPEVNQKKIWYYKPRRNNRQRRIIYNHSKKLLYEILHRGITTHDLRDIHFLIKLLPRSTVIDSYALFRYIMILINSADTRAINKNFIMYLDSNLVKYDLSKPDVFVEYLTYFIKNNRIEDARELFTARHKYMSYRYHRDVLYNDVNMASHSLLMNYIDWHKRVASQDRSEFDVSIQGWLVNAMDPLKQVQHNYEFFIMCIVNVLLHYGRNKHAYLLVSDFQQTNPDNISGHLLLYNLIKKLAAGRDVGRRRVNADCEGEMEVDDPEIALKERRLAELSAINNFSADVNSEPFEMENYPIASDNQDILRNLIRLDPSREEIFELSETYHDKIATIQVIMDSLMELPAMRETSRWRYLKEHIDEVISSDDPNLVISMKTLWQTRYQPYWVLDDIIRVARDLPGSSLRDSHSRVIKRVIRALKSNFDCDVPMGIEDEESEIETSYPHF